jgi:hypothetical protein
MKFASAIYGGLVMNKIFFKDCKVSPHELALASSTEAVTKILCAHCAVQEEDVLYVDCRDTELDRTHQPGVAVVLDHSTLSVVVVVRGTITLQDALTDLAAAREPIGAGSAHAGILLSARNTLQKVEPILETLRIQYPNYPVKLVGHSLGAGLSVLLLLGVLMNAGTAALLCMLMKAEHPEWPVRCFAFACPAVVSLEVGDRQNGHVVDHRLQLAQSALAQELISTYVLNADVVPRLSIGSIRRLRSDADELVG